ncbi:MAG: amidase family protein [Thermoanaerobaculia bacterium]|nr:amidase family protein [Thermoanaerobaculia bacterium]
MGDGRAEVGGVLAGLARRLRDARASQTRQNELLATREAFAELVELARIDRPGDEEEWWRGEGRYLWQRLGAQIQGQIAHLIVWREELEEIEPLHRLPIPAQSAGRGLRTPPTGARFAGRALTSIFPVSDPEGWLVVRKAGSSRIGRRDGEGGDGAGAARPAAPSPAERFETDLAGGASPADALAAYLPALAAANGVLPAPTRDAEAQRRLRELERRQIAAALAGDGRLVAAGGLDALVELLRVRDARETADLDRLQPLASLWAAAVRASDGHERALEGTRPELSAADVGSLGIELDEGERRSLLDRLRGLPPNSFLSFFPADEILARYEPGGPLDGWLCGVKDLFTLGRTTAASAILERFDAVTEATAVTRLRRAGCLFPGKTSLDEFALGSSNETAAFKPTPGCPADRLRVAGGSSGGSAAAVAAGLVRFALGTDTAGSIRVPGAYCGVVGWKPSYGLVSRYGVLPLSMGLDVIGLLTRTVADCVAAASVIAGEDPRDETTRGVEPVDFGARTARLTGRPWRVGVPVEYFLNVEGAMRPLYRELVGGRDLLALRELAREVGERARGEAASDPAAADVLARLGSLDKFSALSSYWEHFDRLLDRIEKLGWSWELVSLPHTWLSIPTYFALSRAELASSLHRYDGVTFGERETGVPATGLQSATRSARFGFQPKIRILLGIHALRQQLALGRGEVDEDFLDLAKRARRAIHDDFARVFERVDLLLTPTTTVLAPPYGGIADPVAQQRIDELTVPADLAGVAAISLPSGVLREDPTPREPEPPALPCAVQLIADRFHDAELFAAALDLERLLREEPDG